MCKVRFTFCAAMVLLLVFTAGSQAGYSGGTGEPNSPFEISIWNFGVENVAVKGKTYVGGLVGGNSGTITNCSSIGPVSDGAYLGGLAAAEGGVEGNG